MFKDMKIRLAKRECQQTIAQLIELMEGHKEQHLPPGHSFYCVLNKRASDAVTKLIAVCQQYGQPMSITEVEAGMPKLNELHQLCGNGAPSGSSHISVAIFASVAGVAVTVYLAALHNVYVYLTHFAWLHR